jgi:hypothetical protein
MVCFMIVMGSWCLTTNDDDIKECDAPKSNKTVAGCELIVWSFWMLYTKDMSDPGLSC